MNDVKWNDRFKIGVDNIDRAHQRLFSIVSKLISLNEDTDKQQHACREGIKYFKSYTLRHFADEEAYMRSIGYSEYDIHKSLHDNMCKVTIPALEEELESQNYSVESVQHFLGICIGWLNAHIMIEDNAITGRTSHKWLHQPKENALISLEKAIAQALEHLFRVKSQLISDHYSGEDFASGHALCYRLSYSCAEGRKRYAYIIYEERIILLMLSELLGKPVKRIDKTVIQAMKLLSQKFMLCICAHFPLAKDDQLEKIDVMTFEQVERMFVTSREYPPYSLLFRTEMNGYFAFCAR